STLGMYQVASGDHAAARAILAQALVLNPKSLFTTAYAGINELLDGKTEAARALFAKGSDDSVWSLLGSSMVEHTLGNDAASRRAIDTMISQIANGSAYQIAEAYAWRGEADKAFEWLDRAFAQRDGGLPLVTLDPTLASLRNDPRYAALRKKMG